MTLPHDDVEEHLNTLDDLRKNGGKCHKTSHLKAFAVEWWIIICPYHFRDPLSGKDTVKVGNHCLC